jgi:hypothetical protein
VTRHFILIMLHLITIPLDSDPFLKALAQCSVLRYITDLPGKARAADVDSYYNKEHEDGYPLTEWFCINHYDKFYGTVIP